MPSPYFISGTLNYGSGGASALNGLGGPPGEALANLGKDYASAYQSALQANQTNYNNILSGYQQLMAQQVPAEQQIEQGYSNLESGVLNTIKGIGASQGQAIRDVYAQQSGASQQALINAGLGNTTVTSSVQRGNTLDYAKAQVALQNQVAQLTAGYQSNLGLAGLNYQNQALMQNTGLGLQQLGFMNSVMAPYPNAGLYGQLAQGYGAMQAANQARGMLGGAQGGALPYGVGVGPASQAPNYAPNPATAVGAGGGFESPYMAASTPYNMSPYTGNNGAYFGGGSFEPEDNTLTEYGGVSEG